MTPRDAERDAQAPSAANRRANPRVEVHSLAYVELGDANAGLILNISETGMAIQAVQSLTSDSLPRMQFRLPRTEAMIQLSGKVVWQIKSKKEVGIEFTALPEQARQAIQKWIAEEENRQAESEETHLNALSELPSPVRERTVRQVYPSERGEEETVALISDSSAKQEEIAPGADWMRPAPPIAPAAGAESSPEIAAASGDQAPRILEAAAARTASSPVPGRIPDRWRPEPATPAPARPFVAPTRQPHQILGAPAWNRERPGPRVLTESRPRRSKLPYAVALLLLAGVGAAGVMALDPGAADTVSARVQALVDKVTASLKHNPPSESAGPTTTPPTNAAPANSNAASPSQPAQNPSAAQTQQPSTNSAQNTPANPQHNAPVTSPSAAQTAAQTNANAATAGPSAASPVQPAGNAPSTASGVSNPADQTQSSSAPPSSAAGGPATSSQPPNDTAQQPPAQSQQSDRSGRQVSSQQSQTDQSALKAGREQTGAPAVSNPGGSSANRAQRPAAEPNQVQDAYANSAPNAGSRAANTTQASPPPPGTLIVEVPGYASAPVPTSTPLTGVPSGFVAGSSQFHAIWIPANLAWAQRYLPGNLGVGQLLSSYSYSPTYPVEAAREGIQGTVKLDVTVNTDGTVRSIRVLSGPGVLSSAAVLAVRDWRYAETFFAGEPVETQQYVTMVFRLAPTQ
jgi:TonB family protein